MRICINYLSVVTGGAEIYALNLLKALTKIDSEDYYLVYLPSDKVESFRVDKKNFKFKSKNFSSPYLRTLWEQFFLPFELWKNKIDILFKPVILIAFFRPARGLLSFIIVCLFQLQRCFHQD